MIEKKKKKNKIYFTEETEKAVLLYNNATSQDEKNTIYKAYLEYPLNKLVENVIHVYKLYNTGITYDQLHDHILEFIIEKLYKINQEHGKAYSYLTVTARNYGFMMANAQSSKNTKELEIENNSTNLELFSYNKYNTSKIQNDLSDFFDVFVIYMRNNLTIIFNDKEEINIADVLIDFFENRQDIQLFNKKSLYITIKESVKCEPRFITNVINTLKYNFYALYDIYMKDGLKNFKYYEPEKRPIVKRRIK